MSNHSTDDDLPFPDFETRDDVRDRSNYLVANFQKSRTEAHRDLGRKLDACTSDHPCQSGACPRCLRVHRLKWIADITRFVANQWGRP